MGGERLDITSEGGIKRDFHTMVNNFYRSTHGLNEPINFFKKAAGYSLYVTLLSIPLGFAITSDVPGGVFPLMFIAGSCGYVMSHLVTDECCDVPGRSKAALLGAEVLGNIFFSSAIWGMLAALFYASTEHADTIDDAFIAYFIAQLMLPSLVSIGAYAKAYHDQPKYSADTFAIDEHSGDEGDPVGGDYIPPAHSDAMSTHTTAVNAPTQSTPGSSAGQEIKLGDERRGDASDVRPDASDTDSDGEMDLIDLSGVTPTADAAGSSPRVPSNLFPAPETATRIARAQTAVDVAPPSSDGRARRSYSMTGVVGGSSV